MSGTRLLVYLNALLANLNARAKLRKMLHSEDNLITDTIRTIPCSVNSHVGVAGMAGAHTAEIQVGIVSSELKP
jgi:hypothetical protein